MQRAKRTGGEEGAAQWRAEFEREGEVFEEFGVEGGGGGGGEEVCEAGDLGGDGGEFWEGGLGGLGLCGSWCCGLG